MNNLTLNEQSFENPLYKICIFLFSAFKTFFFITHFEEFDFNVPLSRFPLVSFVLASLSFLELYIYACYKFENFYF